MTLQELITDLKAAGANENTVRLAMNCYELGRVNEREQLLAVCGDAVAAEREACAQLCDSSVHDTYIEGYTGAKHTARRECASAIRARGQQ